MKNKERKHHPFLNIAYYFFLFLALLLFSLILFRFFYKPSVFFENKFSANQNIPSHSIPLSEVALPLSSTNITPFSIQNATFDQLITLPGIGPVTAQNILDFSHLHGPFHFPEDLLFVNGIGEATLEKILPYLLFDE